MNTGINRLDTVGVKLPEAGQYYIQLLALSTIQAMQRAGLDDLLDIVRRRVLDRPADEICEVVGDDGQVSHLAYRPMVELLLREILHAARAPHCTTRDRRTRIAWALGMAGV